MQRIENAEYFHAKGACYLCHQPHDCVDTSIIIEGEGVLAICHGCIADLARTSGYDLDDRSVEIEHLKAELEDASERADAAEGYLLSIAGYAKKIKDLAKARQVRAEKHAEKQAVPA